MSKKRLFVAIPLPESILTEIAALQNKLKPFARDAKWVKTAGIHLTLKFLGYVDPGQIPAIVEQLRMVASAQTSAQIRAKGCGFFPNARRPNVLWVGVEADLQHLYQDMEDRMAGLGFEKEDRAFAPHLTLARFRDPKGLLPLAQETQKYTDHLLGEFIATAFTLYESVLRPQGAEYHNLETFQLK